MGRNANTDRDSDLAVVAGVPKSKCTRIMASLRNAIQAKNDATADHAIEWKSAKDDGIHNQAMKLCLSLERMEEQKRSAWLTAFDAYRCHLFPSWDAQQVMPFIADADQKAAQRVVQSGPDDDEVGETGFSSAEDDLYEGLPDVVDAMSHSDAGGFDHDDDHGAPWSGEGAPVTGDVPEDSGAIFNAGHSAGLDGDPEDGNPHEPGGSAHQLWAKGWLRGSNVLSESRERSEASGSSDVDQERVVEADEPETAAEHDGDDTPDTPSFLRERGKRSARIQAAAE